MAIAKQCIRPSDGMHLNRHVWIPCTPEGVYITRSLGSWSLRVPPGPVRRKCNGCGHLDLDAHMCREVVSTYIGLSSNPGVCGRAGSLEYVAPDGTPIHEDQTGDYCKTHHPDNKAARSRASASTASAKWDAEILRERRGRYGTETAALLAGLGEWAGKNLDLVEADEWLGRLVRDAEGLQSKLLAPTRGY